MKIKELNNDEMAEVNGGTITSAMVNAIVSVVEAIFTLGEKTGSSIRRMITGELCEMR